MKRVIASIFWLLIGITSIYCQLLGNAVDYIEIFRNSGYSINQVMQSVSINQVLNQFYIRNGEIKQPPKAQFPRAIYVFAQNNPKATTIYPMFLIGEKDDKIVYSYFSDADSMIIRSSTIEIPKIILLSGGISAQLEIGSPFSIKGFGLLPSTLWLSNNWKGTCNTKVITNGISFSKLKGQNNWEPAFGSGIFVDSSQIFWILTQEGFVEYCSSIHRLKIRDVSIIGLPDSYSENRDINMSKVWRFTLYNNVDPIKAPF